MAEPHSSGDLAADRRYRYAEELLREGDPAAASDLLRQTLELVPRWGAAWFKLGEALEEEWKWAEAAEAYRQALSLDPADVLGAGMRIAAIDHADPDAGMSPAYVAKLFDQYAPKFDRHLRVKLDYVGPEIILDALTRVCAGRQRDLAFRSVMDLGCGTGLMAKAIRPHAEAIDGVDLSPEMVKLAQSSGVYRRVEVGDVVEALDAAGGAGATYDLVLAADVVVYMRDLGALFRAAARVLRPDGLFALTAQRAEGKDVSFGRDLRYSHGPDFLRETAAAAGLAERLLEPCVTRTDANRAVPGQVAVFGWPDG